VQRCFDIDEIDIDEIGKQENLLHGGAASNERVREGGCCNNDCLGNCSRRHCGSMN